MTRDQVLQRLCALASEVGRAMGHKEEHDCFCGSSLVAGWHSFQFSEGLMVAIEDAVKTSMGLVDYRHLDPAAPVTPLWNGSLLALAKADAMKATEPVVEAPEEPCRCPQCYDR